MQVIILQSDRIYFMTIVLIGSLHKYHKNWSQDEGEGGTNAVFAQNTQWVISYMCFIDFSPHPFILFVAEETKPVEFQTMVQVSRRFGQLWNGRCLFGLLEYSRYHNIVSILKDLFTRFQLPTE